MSYYVSSSPYTLPLSVHLSLWLNIKRPKPPTPPPTPENTVFFNYASQLMTEDVLPRASSRSVVKAGQVVVFSAPTTTFVNDLLFNEAWFYKANIGNYAVPAADVSYDAGAQTVTVQNVPSGATGPLYLYQLALWRDIMANMPELYYLVNQAQADATTAIADSAAAVTTANAADANATTAIADSAAAVATANTAETNSTTAIADAATALSTAESRYRVFSNQGSTGNYADGVRTTFNNTGIPSDIDVNSVDHSFTVAGIEFNCVSPAIFDAAAADAKVFKLTYAGPAVGNLVTTKYAPCAPDSLERVVDGTGAVVNQPLVFSYCAVVA